MKIRSVAAVLGCAAWLCPAAVHAVASYETQGTDLVVTVPSSETVDLDVSRLTSQTRLVKRGAGKLKTTSTLANFAGEILVEQGVLNAYWVNSLGTSEGGTIVSSGASLEIEGPMVGGGTGEITETQLPGLQLFPGERITIAGKGPDGRGALVTRVFARCSNVKYLHGSVLALSADALVRGLRMSQNITEKLDLNGHVLMLEPGEALQNYAPEGTISSGEVAVQSGGLNNPATTLPDSATVVRLYKGGGIHLEGFKAAFTTPLICQSNEGYLRIAGAASNFTYEDGGSWTIDRNVWNGSIGLTNSLRLTTGTAGCAIRINGDVTGPGGFVVGPNLGLLMTGTGYNFKGGVKMNEGGNWLQVSSPACISGDGAAIEITNGKLSFCNWKPAYSLPEAVFGGNSTVKWGCQGAWKKLTKTGSGELYYDSGFGGFELKVTGGGVFFPMASTDKGASEAPTFTNLSAVAGTYLRFGAAHAKPFAVSTMTGVTTISNGVFAIGEKWTVDAASIATGGRLEVCDGALNFGAAAEIVLENEKLLSFGHTYEIARAKEAITSVPPLTSRRFILRRSDDGKALCLVSRGFILTIR